MAPVISAATLALISETERVTAKELPEVHTALIVSRVFDQAGQPILRRFTCSAEVFGQMVACTGGSRFAAHKELQRQIKFLGYEPMWTAVRDLTVFDSPAEESEVPDVEPVFCAPREIPNMEPEHSLQSPANESEEVGEHEHPDHGLVACVPVCDKAGWLTPLSDPLAYRRVYLAAWLLAVGVSAYASDRMISNSRDIRSAVAAVMMSGDAGASVGIPAIAVNPWSLGTNGEKEMLWVRVSPKTPDPTTAPFRSGMGVAREAHLKTLSGLAAFPEKAEEWMARREARKFIGTRGVNTVGAKEERSAKRGQAHAAGSAAKTIAFEAGEDAATAELHYRWVYCATLRNLGEIHTLYESQLAESGISEAEILEYAAAQKAA